jgi:UDP-glucose 4-epimerase
VVLVTGGMGFIGLHTARRLLDAGEDVVLTRHRSWRLPAFLEPDLGGRLRVEALDLAEGWGVVDVIGRHAVTSVVHLAAPALGAGPAREYGSALTGWLNVLEAARRHGVRRVSLASSVAVYANAGAGPWAEDRPLPVESDSHTAAAKKAMEVVGLHFADRTGLDVRVLRLAAIYGPLYHSMANLPSRLCHAAASGAPPDLGGVRVGTAYADDASDLCYVRDCAAGIGLAHLGERLRHRVYNIGAGRAVTNAEVARAVAAAAPGAATALPPGGSDGSSASSYMTITRIQEDTGYAPSYDIRQGIADYVAWLRSAPPMQAIE